MRFSNKDILKMVNECLNRLVEDYNYNQLIKPDEEFPNVFYHVSNPKNRKSILKNGLVPSVGDSYSAHAEGEGDDDLMPVIFISGKNNYDSTWDDDRWAINGSLLDKESIFKDFDSDMENSYVYNKIIPPDALKLLHKGTGKSL